MYLLIWNCPFAFYFPILFLPMPKEATTTINKWEAHKTGQPNNDSSLFSSYVSFHWHMTRIEVSMAARMEAEPGRWLWGELACCKIEVWQGPYLAILDSPLLFFGRYGFILVWIIQWRIAYFEGLQACKEKPYNHLSIVHFCCCLEGCYDNCADVEIRKTLGNFWML